MARSTMFFDWKNQYCENDCTTQNYLQIQYNLYRITKGIFSPTELEQNFSNLNGSAKDPEQPKHLKKGVNERTERLRIQAP